MLKMNFSRKGGLGAAITAKSAAGVVIGVHGVGVHLNMRYLVGTACKGHHAKQNRLTRRGIRPGIAIDFNISRQQLALFRGAHFVMQVCCVPLVTDEDGFFTAPMHFDRPSGMIGSQSRVNLPGHIFFAAKTAAHIHMRNLNLFHFHTKYIGHLGTIICWPLATDINLNRSILFKHANTGLSLHVGMFHKWDTIGLFINQVGFCKTCLDISLGYVIMLQHIGHIRVNFQQFRM